MVALATILLLTVALAASFFAAWAIGAGSSGATPFAPAVGANAITTMRAAFIVGLVAFLGAVLQGAAVTETIGQDLIVGETLTPLAATVALSISALAIAAGVFKGYPIATAFAISGGVAGVGIAMGGDPAWQRYGEITAYWVLTPVFVTPVAYVVTKLLRNENYSELVVLSLLSSVVGLTIANMEFLLLGSDGQQESIASRIAMDLLPFSRTVGVVATSILIAGFVSGIVFRSARRNLVASQQNFLLGLGILVAFTAGGGKVGLAVGPLLPLLEDLFARPMITPVLIFGAVGMLLGTWMVASRMIKALSQDYSSLGPRRSVGVLIPSFVIAQIGIFFGLPMSFNQIFIFAMLGAGYAAGGDTVSQKKMFYTVVAWVASLVFSFVVGYGVYLGVSELLGVA